MEGLELICFQIISNAGDAKSSLFEAIELAKASQYEEAYKKAEDADKKLLKAHEVHMDLIQKDMGGEKVEFSLILMHAEDQMMQTELLKKLTEEFIDIYKKIN